MTACSRNKLWAVAMEDTEKQCAMLVQRYEELLSGDPVIGPDGKILTSASERMRELRRMVVVNGLPRSNENDSGHNRKCSLRGCIWKLLLGVQCIDSQRYIQLVKFGPSIYDEDIRNDTFRTFTSDAEFARRVPEDKLARLLNAFVHEMGPKKLYKDSTSNYRYVQGMNILSGPFLYTMPEVDAYFSFCELITKHCPRYVAPNLEGVLAGCQLVDECLEAVDPVVYEHLYSRGITATIYAFPLVLSLFACSPPLKELLRVWDVLLAMGIHFIVVLCIAHVVLLRSQLVCHSTPMEIMKVLNPRKIPQLDSDLLISVAFQLLHRIPEELLYRVACHPFRDPESIAAPWSMYTHLKSRDTTRLSARIYSRGTSPVRYVSPCLYYASSITLAKCDSLFSLRKFPISDFVRRRSGHTREDLSQRPPWR